MLGVRKAWLAATAFALAAPAASGQCVRVVDVERDLPHEVDTPLGHHLSYFYNLQAERYVVVAARADGAGVPHGPYALTRGCAPAELRWESAEFVVLSAGCGTFCWSADVLPVASVGGPAQRIERPLEFEAERNLLVYYAGQGEVRIRNLTTLYEQEIRMPAPCVSASATCIDSLRLTPVALEYVFERFVDPGSLPMLEAVSVELAADLTRVPETGSVPARSR